MRKFITGLATLTALAAGLPMIGSRAEAAAIPAAGLRAAIDTFALTETVQLYVWGGRRYCWYDDGWQGPGWYVVRLWSLGVLACGGAAGTAGIIGSGGTPRSYYHDGRRGGQ